MLLVLFASAPIAGCLSHFRKVPPPGETIKEDIPLTGYEVWIDFEARPEEVYEYLQDTDNVAKAFDWMTFEKKGGDTGRLEAPGDGIHFRSIIIGVPFSGRMVVTDMEFAQTVDIFHVMSVWSRQQWWREDLEDGRARMNLRIITEMPDVPFLSYILTPEMFAKHAGRRVDYSIERVKADLEGLPMPVKYPEDSRGEIFSSTVRIYRTAIEIKRPRDQVYEFITRLDNFNRASEMLRFEPTRAAEKLSWVGQQCGVSSTPGAPFDLTGKSLIVESEPNRLIHHLIYFEKSFAGFMVKLHRRGINNTLLEYTFYYQIPDYSSEELITTLHAVSRLDEALRLALSNIRKELESGPP